MARPLVERFQSRLSDLIFEFRDLHSANLIAALQRELDQLQSTKEEK